LTYIIIIFQKFSSISCTSFKSRLIIGGSYSFCYSFCIIIFLFFDKTGDIDAARFVFESENGADKIINEPNKKQYQCHHRKSEEWTGMDWFLAFPYPKEDLKGHSGI
jgi:hypothetical protein